MSQAAPLRVAIVGCGIAGLSAALALQDRGRARGVPVDLTLFDAASRAGGVIQTERSDGFVVEAGPDCFITDKPWALRLCERLGLKEELCGTNPACRRSFVLRGRRLLPVPEGFYLMAPASLLPFALSPTLSLMGKLRAAMDLVLPRGEEQPDESLASFVRRRFGDEVLERLAQPLFAGIYNADPERLSLRATMPRFLELERRHRSVIAGLMRGRRDQSTKIAAEEPASGLEEGEGLSGARYSLFVTPRRGMAAIVERLVQQLPPQALHLQTRVLAIEPLADGRAWRVRTERGETLPFQAVILALKAPEAAALLKEIDPDIATRLSGIHYGGTATVCLGWKTEDLPYRLDGFGFVVPRSEGRALIACSFSSVKFPGRAPDGRVLLRAFTSEALALEGNSGRLLASVRQELRDILGIEAAPLLERAYFHAGSMPQYEVGHLERAAELESRLERHAGLALAGNGLRGVGVPDCVRSGEAAADRILSQAPQLVS